MSPKRMHPLAAAPALALLAAALVAAPATAQEHDLILEGLSFSPDPLERGCPASLSASVRVNGLDDFEVPSGGARIRFFWADGSGPVPVAEAGWTAAATLPVTFAAGEFLAVTLVWPDAFSPVSGSSVSWTVPGVNSLHLRALVEYTTGETDDSPADNELVRTVNTAAGSCGPPPCFNFLAHHWLCYKDFFKDLEIIEQLGPCWKNPEDCFGPITPVPELCKLIDCPPCLAGLSCPPDRLELLLASRPGDLVITLFGDRQAVATAERLEHPVRRGQRAFNYRLTFRPEQGVTYRLGVAAGETTPGDEPLKLEAAVFPARKSYGEQ